MEPDPNVQAIIASFSALSSNQARQAAYSGILDQLVLDEWREVKDRINPRIFQRDLVGSLPLEIVALIVEYWELVDIILFRRVSKRWQEVLSSSIVCRAAYRANTGTDVSSIHSPWQFTKLLEKRIRQERGRPIIGAHIKCAQVIPPNVASKAVFNDGVLAWIEEETECASVAIINLWTGKQDRFMTENRDELLLIRVSKGFLAALTIQGYCHVWNLDSHEEKSFRLPSTDAHYHFLINGTKVVIGFESYLVHWCFNSEVTRQVETGCKGQLVALHAPEDRITVASLETKNFEFKFDQTSNLQLHVQKFSINDSGTVSCVLSRRQNISLDTHLVVRYLDFGEIKDETFGGYQSTTFFEYVNEETDQEGSCFLSLEPDGDTISFDLLPGRLGSSSVFPVHSNLAYSRSNDTKRICILKSMLWKPGVHRYSMCGSGLPGENYSMCADSDFVVLFDQYGLQIWAFDEKWVPPEVPGLVVWRPGRDMSGRCYGKNSVREHRQGREQPTEIEDHV
ncbi:hypothetical protein N7474_010577 [Penicillium riverlandense]|uniref:uncharacterized protein n=1 Tax=Penicillium riverlandense TaxID=1903569 RepID=UPI002546B3F3|nr:uncharacterized protein N7474_010577 [Penicillium riverlandense]KAJ5806985.1 hypothetical protein N7474_010577 [Penicillium riverlandense]